MKRLLFILLVISKCSFSQQCQNIFIITTDGYRWQELFNGADSAIICNTKYVGDTGIVKGMYWSADCTERRKKLMPFMWNYVVNHGQLWGNRNYDNTVSVTNNYQFSYAGYNELLTGYADPFIVGNKQRYDNNTNLLAFLNELPEYKNKVAAFGSWRTLAYILNDKTSGIEINCGYENIIADSLSANEQALNYIQDNVMNRGQSTRSDLLTYTVANEYIKKNHPRVVYIGFGETDEFAHSGRYDDYLSKANQFDKFLSELWTMIQRDELYKNKTTLFITTDHGRGEKTNTWIKHGLFTRGSDETWMVQIGPNIQPAGEMKTKESITNDQFAQTIASYLDVLFITGHHVSDAAEPLLSQRIK